MTKLSNWKLAHLSKEIDHMKSKNPLSPEQEKMVNRLYKTITSRPLRTRVSPAQFSVTFAGVSFGVNEIFRFITTFL